MAEGKVKIKKKFNKMTIAVIVLSLALVAAIGAIFGVYAALQQNVYSSFSVGYTIGENVAVAIGAASRRKNNSDTQWFTCSDSNIYTYRENSNLYMLDAPRGNANAMLEGPDVTYSDDFEVSSNDEVYMCFYFLNVSNENSMTVSISDNSYSENMCISYFGGIVEDTDSLPSECLSSYYPESGMSPGISTSASVEAGELYCFLISIYCYNPNLSANFTSSGSSSVSFVVS